jgi:hypothetical protein
MWIGVLFDDLLVVENSRSAETTLTFSHPIVANQSLTREISLGAKLQEGNKQAQSKVITPNRVVVMTDLVAMHANGELNMDINIEYVCSYGHGYVLFMLGIS